MIRTNIAVVLVMMLPLLAGCPDFMGDKVGSSASAPPQSNGPPMISGTPGTSVKFGEPYSFTPTASDPDGDPLTFNVQNKPRWASFDTAIGRLSGVPNLGDEGSYDNVTISVSDGQDSSSLKAFSVTVTQVSLGSITLSWAPPTQNEDGSALTNLAAYKFYYGKSPGSYSNQIRVNNPGLSTYVIENLSPATYYIVATAINSSGVESRFSNEASKQVL